MLIHKHKIWSYRLRQYLNSLNVDRFKMLGLFVGLFFIIFLFSMKIIDTVNNGLATQKRTEKIAQEVEALEKEKQVLTYQSELYKSDTQIEAQYRELVNKKKEGEKVYRIATDSSVPTKSPEVSASNNEVRVDHRSNWELWLERIFN